MRLKKKQKEFLLARVAEGLTSDEINVRAKGFKPPFEVSRQTVDYYRDSRSVKLQELKDESESEALRTGLALKEGRVEALKELAERLRRELMADGDDGRLWLRREKAIGSGGATKFIEEFDFNLTQLNALRALLDDIAKEMGGRTYGISEESEGEDDSEDASPVSSKELRIKVEYVGGDNPDAPNSAPSATDNQSSSASL